MQGVDGSAAPTPCARAAGVLDQRHPPQAPLYHHHLGEHFRRHDVYLDRFAMEAKHQIYKQKVTDRYGHVLRPGDGSFSKHGLVEMLLLPRASFAAAAPPSWQLAGRRYDAAATQQFKGLRDCEIAEACETDAGHFGCKDLLLEVDRNCLHVLRFACGGPRILVWVTHQLHAVRSRGGFFDCRVPAVEAALFHVPPRAALITAAWTRTAGGKITALFV